MINQQLFQQSAKHYRSGRISLTEFQSRVFSGMETKPGKTKPSPQPAASPDVTLDLDRANRCGWSEVIYGEGKTTETLVDILNQLKTANQPALITRVSDSVGKELADQITDGQFDSASQTFTRGDYAKTKTFKGNIAVVAAGTSDLPVLEEACATIRWMGGTIDRIVDVGVAGPDRLTPHLETLKSANAIVVVAGMEGALPSVVAGHVGCPVFAVPTSVGYGANLEGIAAFLAMVNSCAANVAVVNIDAGFKAGYLAAMVASE